MVSQVIPFPFSATTPIARDHVASHFVELSMLTEDGKVRR